MAPHIYHIILLIYLYIYIYIYDITIMWVLTHYGKHHRDMVTRMLNTLHALELKQV